MNYIFSIFVAAIRALSMFLVGKIILESYGTQTFAAHAQLSQLITVLLPISCGLTTLAIINACANFDWERVLRVLQISVGITVALVLSFAVLSVALDSRALSTFLFGTSEWQGTIMIAPIAVALASVTSLATASLIGFGKGRWAAGTDACMSLCALIVVALASYTDNIGWLIYSPLPVLGIGALIAIFAVFINRPLFLNVEATSLTHISSPRNSIGSYMMMSFAASAIAPTAILLARSTLLNETGPDAASSFIAAQRLAALAVAPVPFYIYTFLSHYFASSNHLQATRKIRHLQIILLVALSTIYLLLTWALPLVTPIAFSAEVRIPAQLFIFVAIGEMARVIAAVQAQYMATHGRWKSFLFGDFVFIGIFLVAFLMGEASGTWIAGAYGLAGIGYLIYMTIRGNIHPKGVSYGK